MAEVYWVRDSWSGDDIEIDRAEIVRESAKQILVTPHIQFRKQFTSYDPCVASRTVEDALLAYITRKEAVIADAQRTIGEATVRIELARAQIEQLKDAGR